MKDSFFKQVNRGGLLPPSDIVFITSLHIYKSYQDIMEDESHRSILLKYECPKKAFSKLQYMLMVEGDETKVIINSKCSSGHQFGRYVEPLADVLFNIMSQNFIREYNDAIHQERKRKSNTATTKASKKIAKLSSEK